MRSVVEISKRIRVLTKRTIAIRKEIDKQKINMNMFRYLIVAHTQLQKYETEIKTLKWVMENEK